MPIKYFLGWSELWLILSDQLLLLVPFIGAMFYGNYLMIILHERRQKKPREIEYRKSKTDIIFQTILGLLGIFILIKLFIADYYVNRVSLISSLGLVLLFFLSVEFDEHHNYKLNKSIWIVCSFGIFLYTIIQLTVLEIKSTEKGKYNGSYIVTKGNKEYHSTDSSYYIGKTENYVFIYNRNQKSATVIPSEEIKEIYLKAR
ncbi:MAG: hypothetical protein J0L56_06010 [Chitinophagales bacterium]|nr:hypothetical protein [Chitinophagales bacterium]